MDNPESSAPFSKVDETAENLTHARGKETSTNLPPFLDNLLTNGAEEPLDFTITINDKPAWLDIKKFENGQKFGRDYLIVLAISEFFATIMLWSVQPILLPVIFAGAFNTPFKAFKRSVSTFVRISSWCEENVWSKEMNTAKKNLKTVQSYHKNFHIKVQSSTQEEITEKTTMKNEINPSFKFLAEDISSDFESSCPALSKINDSKFGINQMNMSLTQFVFVGFAVTYPKYFGIHYATDEQLESYVHVWRALGYLLGIKDEYNFCNCDLDGVRKRTEDIINLVLKPSFTNLTDKWEYIFRCIIDSSKTFSIGVGFETYLLYLSNIFKINSTNLIKRTSWYDFLCFYMLKFFLGFIMKIPYVSKIASKKFIETAKIAQKNERELLSKMEAKCFPYVAKKNN